MNCNPITPDKEFWEATKEFVKKRESEGKDRIQILGEIAEIIAEIKD
jgi:hypothetical protein